MIRINLLPAEERVRKRSLPKIKVPQVGAFVPFVFLGLVVAGIASLSTLQTREIAGLEAKIAEMQEESDRFKPQLEQIRQITQRRQEVRNRLDIIAKLDRDRYYRVQVLDELSKSLPRNMWLSNVVESDERNFTMEGITFSNFNVAQFMKNLDAKDRFNNVDLTVAEQGRIEDLDVVKFSLSASAQP